MNTQELKEKLQEIVIKMQQNKVSAWHSDLEGQTEAFAIEDHIGDAEDHYGPSVTYNGWYDDLRNLISEL
jgi:hypothetical protein